MKPETLPLWLALLTQLGLGIAVFRANPRHHSNQSFLLVSATICTWLFSLHFAYTATSAPAAAFWIRTASASGLLIVLGFNLLRLTVVLRGRGWRTIITKSTPLLLVTVILCAVCYTDWFLSAAIIRSGLTPKPIYGPLLPVYLASFVAMVVLVLSLYLKDLRQVKGLRKVELQFVIAGSATMCALAVLGIVLRPLLAREVVVFLAPFRVVIFTLIIAYGIATRKIMEVGFFFRRVTAYAVLSAYLMLLYGVIWWLVFGASHRVFPDATRALAHIAAALAVAFAMAPARGVSQSLANRLFVSTRGLDFRSTVNKATAILRSVTTLRALLERFAKTIGEALDTDQVLILLPSRNGFAQSYPEMPPGLSDSGLELGKDHPVVIHLEQHQEMIVLDELSRVRSTPELDRVRAEMETLRVAAAIGIFSREHLAGVMLLGARKSGRIYGSVEQNALQVLCGQLGVAIENAELFTEVQNAKLYNETLLENLTSGVIAAGADERVTVFNNEAGQITGLDPREIIDRPISQLPESLREIMRETLRSDEQREYSELILSTGNENVVVRASSSIFHGQNGEMLGALMVLTDITALKRLEQQIRRTDRLASMGTLSAGMAHEIKNPLVSIKTFAQLLPERYQDSEFRETFSNLIGHEIDRIDSLVNQLLRFARPAKPLLKPTHIHEVLEKSLSLLQHKLYQKEIKIIRSWNADVDTIKADADQLEQVFLNFFLNAMDAMKHGGELVVGTEIHSAKEWVASFAAPHVEVDEILRVTVKDTGEGIKHEDIAHVFDPFFTTKDYGTGLGLSVVHGIIQEHGGQIEVESEVSKGTAFHILLPLVRFEEKVAAA